MRRHSYPLTGDTVHVLDECEGRGLLEGTQIDRKKGGVVKKKKDTVEIYEGKRVGQGVWRRRTLEFE